MRIIPTLLISVLIISTASAQTVETKVKEKTKQRVDNKTDESIDKGLNKTEDAINNLFKKKDKKKKKTDDSNTSDNNESNNNQSSDNTQAAFSDFVPGNSVIFSDNFQQDALQDFPAKWNTNGSGKVVTIKGQKGKWLDIVHNTIVNPVMDKQLPENCTIEFDMFLQVKNDMITPYIEFGLTQVRDLMKDDIFAKNKFFVSLNRYDENDGRTLEYGLKSVVGNKNDFPLPSYANKVLHVSMSINKTRVRVYFDKSKLIDLPRALTPELRNNFYFANMYMVPASSVSLLISNFRVAAAETDARSLLIKQLMDEGRAVTSDILFDVNSDVIKKESYNIVDQFGEALKTNSGLRIRITGHTDSDGSAVKNMELSKNRAAAVKRYLITNYSIDESRIQVDGKGATQPVSDNSTASGKAKNRRVEFTKL